MGAVQVTTSVTSFTNMAKGAMAITLLDYNASALSVIHEGSVLEVAGSCFRWDAAETPGTWTTCTTAATAYLTCVPSGSAGSQVLTSGWTNTAPTWHDTNQGWYASAGSSSRVIASAYKTSNTSQNNKRLLRDPILHETRSLAITAYSTIHADGAIDSDTTISADGKVSASSLTVTGTVSSGTVITAAGVISGSALTVTNTIHANAAIDSDTTISADGKVSASSLTVTGTVSSGTIISAAGGIVAGTGNATFLIKSIDIGDWNMDTTSAVTVATGIGADKVRLFSCIIRSDGTQYYAIPCVDIAGVSQAWISDASLTSTATFTLRRLAGGTFDNAGFDSASYNRGWLTIAYEP